MELLELKILHTRLRIVKIMSIVRHDSQEHRDSL